VRTRNFVTLLAVFLITALAVYAAQDTPQEKPAQPADAPQSKSDGEKPTAPAIKFANDMDKVSYIIGTQVGQTIIRQKIDVNLDMFVKGLKDTLDEKELALTPQQIQEVMAKFQQSLLEKRQKQAEQNLTEGKAFLEQNKTQEGIKVTPSGLQYKVIKEGAGKTPQSSDRVKTHYRGTLIDGKEFDSSYQRNQPAEFAVAEVIKGWTEALLMMKEGAKWQLFVPSDLAYGTAGRPSIPPHAVLIFEIELLEVLGKQPPPPPRE